MADGDKAVDSKVRWWLGEVAAAKKRERDWRKDAKRILDIYNGKKADEVPFNILYSNTETLLPALYNSQPRPVVQRRFKDEDPFGKLAAGAGQRVLEFLGDTNTEEYESFDSVLGDAVIDALLPGRGCTRVRYDAAIYEAEGEIPQVKNEIVCYESVVWDRISFGFSKKWKRVPWIAFEHDVTRSEAERLFGHDLAVKLEYVSESAKDDVDDDERKPEEDKTEEERKVAKLFEIWVRKSKSVLFVSPNHLEGILKEDEDPLELSGFFPLPEPLRFLRKANNLLPTPIYLLYENQAKELNRLTIRINRITEAIKVRGVYDSTLAEIDDLLKKDDNTLVPAQNVAALQEKGLDKAIWLMPLTDLVTVLSQLLLARQQAKNVVYEITGISDILRGSTVASETATAQEIKNQWGTLRLKRMQRQVQAYARDLERLSLEVAAKKFSEETFAKMTGLPFVPTVERQNAQLQVSAAQMMMQPPPPEAAAMLQQPSWEQVLGTLRDDTQRAYRIDIETNSTVDLEATEDQKNMNEVLGAVASFIQGVTPLVVAGTMPFEVAQAMLLAIVRRYRFGTEIEDYIKQMQPPKPEDDGKAEAAKIKAQQDQQAFEFEMKQKERDAELEAEKGRMEMELMREEHRLKLEEMRANAGLAKLKAQLAVQQLEAKVAAARAMPKKQSQGEGANAAA